MRVQSCPSMQLMLFSNSVAVLEVGALLDNHATHSQMLYVVMWCGVKDVH